MFKHELTARELLASLAGGPGPDLRDPRSIHQLRRLARWGMPTYESARAARRRAACHPEASARTDAAPRDAVGVNTVWSANAPPAGLGA
jgi:hypothetical protein